MKKIESIMVEVCASCQNKCIFCAHNGMISAYGGYQLEIKELEKFIDYTKDSGYFFEIMHVHGIGEPLLWNHFDEGMKLLKKSDIAGKIIVTTNGLLLDKIRDETWQHIDLLSVSVYPDYPKRSLLQEKKDKYKDKIQINLTTLFRAKPIRGYHHKIPCYCICHGPMFVKDKIFLYCGPPVFDAAKLSSMDIFKCRELYVEIKPNYLESFDEEKIGNIKFCNYCCANGNINMPFYPHGYSPSKEKFILTCLSLDAYDNSVVKLKESLKKRMPEVYFKLKKIKKYFRPN